MEETFEQKVIRNIKGKFGVYKTSEVVGDKSFMPNLEWANPDDVDKFFLFAEKMGAKIIYVTEGEETDDSGQTKNSILQVGFLHQGIMHHINYADEDEEEDAEEDDEYDKEDNSEAESSSSPNQTPF